MGVSDHEQQATDTTVATHIIVVSTSRTEDTDTTGPKMARMVQEAGHPVSGPEIVADDPLEIGAVLDAAIGSPQTRCVLLCGGTGPSLRDVTADVVAERIDRPLPGFGELFRTLSFEEVGAAAMLSRACGGISGRTLIFALPGSPKAGALALQRLILPTLKHLVSQLDKESPLPDDTAPVARGWQAAVAAMQGTLVVDAWPTLPAPLAERGAVRALFDTAGQRGVLACPNRRRYAIFGFPDLERPTSKVLLTGDGGRSDYVVALHRFPDAVGILGPGAPELVQTHDAPTRKICREVTGAPPPDEGFTAFAIDKGLVYLEKDGAIGCWNGRDLEDEGLPSQVGASLALRWSQR